MNPSADSRDVTDGHYDRDAITDVVLIVADQWRADVLGVLDTPGVQTPNLDALARRSTLFTNHWCQASPCGPARRTLLTGTETPVHRQWTNTDPVGPHPSPLTVMARERGLDPLLIGYTDTPTRADPNASQLHDPGFEMIRPFHWQLGFPTYRHYLLDHGLGPLDESMMGIYPSNGEPSADGLAPSAIPAEHSDVAWLTNAAINTLKERPAPMLLHLNWLRPHPPLVAPRPYHRVVSPEEVSVADRALDFEAQMAVHPFFDLVARGRPMKEYTQRRGTIESVTETHERQALAAYYGLCAEVDHHLGRLVDALAATGRDQTTMIVFLSDHGDAMGDHWLYGRTGPFDDHFKVPCLVHDPRPLADAGRGRHVDTFTCNADIGATIAAALRATADHGLGGRSLLPWIEGREATGWRTHVRLHMDWTEGIRSSRRRELTRPDGPQRFGVVRSATHRYVEFDDMAPLLFELTEDPDETVNRATDPSAAAIVDELRSLLHA